VALNVVTTRASQELIFRKRGLNLNQFRPPLFQPLEEKNEKLETHRVRFKFGGQETSINCCMAGAQQQIEAMLTADVGSQTRTCYNGSYQITL